MYWSWYGSKYNETGIFWGLFYEPLFLVGSVCPPFANLIDAYLLLWV